MDADLAASVDEAIERAVDRACDRDMVYGQNDCTLWCADVLTPFLGCDPMAAFRGRYADPEAAQSLYGPLGLARAVAHVASRAGWPRIGTADAALGDLGIVKTNFGPACTLFWRMDMWVGPISRGYATAPRQAARFVWSPLSCRR